MTKEKLRLIRKSSGLTQAEFAKKLGLSRTHYVSLETGANKITSMVGKVVRAMFKEV